MDFCELVHPDTAKALTAYDKDFYKGMAALTVNSYGSGRCFYIAARTADDFLTDFYRHVAGEAGVMPVIEEVPYGVGVAKRIGQGGREYLFLSNFMDEDKHVKIPEGWTDLLGEETVSGEISITPCATVVLGRG